MHPKGSSGAGGGLRGKLKLDNIVENVGGGAGVADIDQHPGLRLIGEGPVDEYRLGAPRVGILDRHHHRLPVHLSEDVETGGRVVLVLNGTGAEGSDRVVAGVVGVGMLLVVEHYDGSVVLLDYQGNAVSLAVVTEGLDVYHEL